MAFFRYGSVLEHMMIVASAPFRIPNVDRAGKLKLVYFTDVQIASVSAAESALMIGTLNPSGATHPPAYCYEIDLTGCTYTLHGIVAGGTEAEYTTPDQPFVITIHSMVLP